MSGGPIIEENYITPSEISNYNKAETLRDHSRSSPCRMGTVGLELVVFGPRETPPLPQASEIDRKLTGDTEL